MPHYYECHVTIDPLPIDQRDKLQDLMKPVHFKLAKLLMVKEDGDPGAPSTYDTFMTAKHAKLAVLKTRLKDACSLLLQHGYVMRRAKIESILFDTKCGDFVVCNQNHLCGLADKLGNVW